MNVYPYRIQPLLVQNTSGHSREHVESSHPYRIQTSRDPSFPLPRRSESNDTKPTLMPAHADLVMPLPLPSSFSRSSQSQRMTNTASHEYLFPTPANTFEQPQSRASFATPPLQPKPHIQRHADDQADQYPSTLISQRLDETKIAPQSRIFRSTQRHASTSPHSGASLSDHERPDPRYSRLVPDLVIGSPAVESTTINSNNKERTTASNTEIDNRNWNSLAGKSFRLDGNGWYIAPTPKLGSRVSKLPERGSRDDVAAPREMHHVQEGGRDENDAGSSEDDDDYEDAFSLPSSDSPPNERRDNLHRTAEFFHSALSQQSLGNAAGAAVPNTTATATHSDRQRSLALHQHHTGHRLETKVGGETADYSQWNGADEKDRETLTSREKDKARKKKYHQRRRREAAAAAAAASASEDKGG